MSQAGSISIVWGDELRTGNEGVDTQHEQLIELFNRLAAVQTSGVSTEAIAPILDELLDYSGYHFRHEAELMRKWRIDEEHQRIHLAAHKSFIQFLQRTCAVTEHYLTDGIENLLLFLSQWLLHHIMGMDVRLTQEIRERQRDASVEGDSSPGGNTRNEMTHMVSELYSRIGDRTFDLHFLNMRLTREIDARRLSEVALLKVDQLLRALIQVGDRLLTADDEHSASTVLCEQVMHADLFKTCCIVQQSPLGETTLKLFAGDADAAELCRCVVEDHGARRSTPYEWSESSILCVNEAEWVHEPPACVERLRLAGLRSWAALPFDQRDGTSSLLMVASTLPDCFDTKIILLLTQASRLLKRAYEQIDLKRSLAEEQQLQRDLARHDVLTGIPNRLGLLEHVPLALARARRHGRGLILGMIDLDDFKAVNDTWGHGAGDRLLEEFARRLRRLVREPDLIARLGGDEFVVVLEDFDERESPHLLIQTLQRLHQAVDKPFELAPGVFTSIDMSMGLAIFPRNGTDVDGLMRHADVALYQSKANKVDRTNWWTVEAPIVSRFPEHAPLTLLDPYGPQAIDLLQKVHDTINVVASDFVSTLYDRLEDNHQAKTVLENLSPEERKALHRRQAEHLRFMLDPSTSREKLLETATHLGKVHALVNVKGSLLIQTSTLYRTLLVHQLVRTNLRAGERYQLQWLINARMEDDIKAQLLAEEMVQENYMASLATEMPAANARWIDAIRVEIDVLNRLPGVKAVALMRLDGRGDFVVEAYAGVIGEQVAAILSDPASRALSDASQPRGQGLTAVAWRSGEIQISAAYHQDLRFAAWHALVAPLQIRSAMAVPVLDPQGHPVAVLGFYGAYPNQFGSKWMSPFVHGIQRRWCQLWQRCHEPRGEVLTPVSVQRYRTRLFEGGLALHMQPIVDLRSGQVVKMEALARLMLDEDRLIPPDEFIALLGEVELTRLFQFGLEQLLDHLVHWHRHGLSVAASINLHPTTFQNPGTPALIAEALSRRGLSPRYLSLELLESGNLENQALQEAFERITAIGVSIEMDDLGSGFSSLQRLSALPFASTKIDRSLVSDMCKDPLKTFSFLAALIALGHDIHRPVVLEGLEQPSMIEVATVLGAAYGQGYALARPMPAEAVLGWATSFSLPATPRTIRTFLGALAYLWWTKRSSQGQTPRTQADCPLAQFLDEAGSKAIEARAWYAHMRDNEYAGPSSHLLEEWLLRGAIAEAERPNLERVVSAAPS